MKCRNCGREINDTAAFCGHCNAIVKPEQRKIAPQRPRVQPPVMTPPPVNNQPDDSTPVYRIWWFWTVIALLLILIVGIVFFGLFAGALWDTAASGASFNALYLFAVGFICGTLINTVMRNNIVTATLLCSVFIPLYHVGYWFFHFVVGGLDSGKFMFLRYYLPGIGYTLLFAPIMFIIVRGIEKYYTED